jgi:hypothetical protein
MLKERVVYFIRQEPQLQADLFHTKRMVFSTKKERKRKRVERKKRKEKGRTKKEKEKRKKEKKRKKSPLHFLKSSVKYNMLVLNSTCIFICIYNNCY